MTPNFSKNTVHASTTKSIDSRNILTKKRLGKYMGFFILGFIIASVLFMIVASKIALNSPLVTILSILTGAYVAVYKFVKHERRALASQEITRLMLGSVGSIWLLTLIYLLALWFLLFDAANREVFFEMVRQNSLPLLGSLVLIISLTLLIARIGIWAFNRLLATP